jgi:hypothetical protein
MLTEVTCVVVRCDPCGRSAFDSGDGGDFDNEAHFDTIEAALEAVQEAEWIVVGDRVTCSRCAEQASCDLTGHEWSSWYDVGPHDFRGGIYVGKRRICWRCNRATEYDPPIPQPERSV